MRNALLIALLGSCIAACSSGKKQLLLRLSEIEAVSDSVKLDLAQIDLFRITEISMRFDTVRGQLVKRTANDTVPAEIVKELDGYLSATSALRNVRHEVEECAAANEKLRKRLKLLTSDIQNQRGDRSLYENFVRQETQEAKAIRAHSISLRQRCEKAVIAHTQFLPPVERFIRTFATR